MEQPVLTYVRWPHWNPASSDTNATWLVSYQDNASRILGPGYPDTRPLSQRHKP